jgi:deoxyribodipyrimidine photo-lyase
MLTATKFERGLMWFRRDLRLHDNTTLQQALSQCAQLHCVFVFDKTILEQLSRTDLRLEFIHASVVQLDLALRQLSSQAGAGLIVCHAVAQEAIPALAEQLQVQVVFAGRDYEPQAIQRDAAVQQALAHSGRLLITCKDHVIFEQREILSQSAAPYAVFTPYKNNWLKRVQSLDLRPHTTKPLANHLCARPEALRLPVPSLQTLGFEHDSARPLLITPGEAGAQTLFTTFLELINHYNHTRDYPAIQGTSCLGVHLRFGTLSIRQLVAAALQRQAGGSEGAAVWLSELVWRDFYAAILANFPHVAERAFKPDFDAILWEQGPNALALFNTWCSGQTGYPLVDAAMAQLNRTGYMHNRLRMLSASFLVKDLGLDWRWGERYFAEKLLDFDLSSNNGGWQWVASSGCDAQPYFRIFNPISQSQKFDPEGQFIRSYLPQLGALSNKAIHAPWLVSAIELELAGVHLGQNYPHPVVQHEQARVQTLARYAVVKKSS